MRLIHPAAIALAAAASAPAQGEPPDLTFETLGEAFSFGFEVLVVGMSAVFLGLMTVFIFLVLLRRFATKRTPREAGAERAERTAPPEVSAEVAHAIALALYMDLRVFDEEEAAHEITVRKVTRPFSPWWNSGRIQNIHDKVDIFRKRG